MLLAESIAVQLSPLSTSHRQNGGDIVTCVIPQLMKDFIYQERSITLPGKESLSIQQLREILPHLYDADFVLEETLASLTGESVDLLKLNTALYQGGNKAYIIFNQAFLKDHPDPYYFITYLSRGKADTEHGQEAVQDFHNLQFTADRFQQVYPSETLGKVNVIRPIQYGLTGDEYPYFTMPFSEQEGEIHLTASEVILPGENKYYFYNYQYAYPYTEHMREVNIAQKYLGSDLIQSVVTQLVMAGLTNEGLIKDLVLKMPVYRELQSQHLQVLRANAHIYAAIGMFPRQFSINAGDWTGTINNLSIPSTTLITIRGGYEKLDDEGWIRRMQGHKEGISVNSRGEKQRFYPYAAVEEDVFRQVLQEVRESMRRSQDVLNG